MLIDGNSIVNRAFYGVPLLTNKEGKYTNGVYGFLNILFKLLDEEKPDHLAVAFDLKAPTFRHKTFDGYKGNRKGMPEELREQMPLLKEMLQTMHISIFEESGVEDIEVDPIDNDAPRYNLMGQPVDDSYRGIVIQNGKKVLIK